MCCAEQCTHMFLQPLAKGYLLQIQQQVSKCVAQNNVHTCVPTAFSQRLFHHRPTIIPSVI
jgi:hypothetical protein